MFTKEDGTKYDSVAEYLRDDATYQGYTREQSDYESETAEEYSHFVNNRSEGQLTDMFTKSVDEDGNVTYYSSAQEYLDQDVYLTEPEHGQQAIVQTQTLLP